MAKLELFMGALLTFMTPSLNEVTIREQSAEDDDILGRMNEGDMIDALNEFVSTIVVSSTYKTSLKDGKLALKDVLNLPLKDKHYILLKSRLHSMGGKMVFEYTCQEPKCGKKEEYTEDLNLFDQDLSSDKSVKIPAKGKDEFCITRYPAITDKEDYKKSFETVLSSGRKIKFSYMNGHAEKAVLEANKNKALTHNTAYLVRDLHVYSEQGWEKISSMNIFSKRDSIEMAKLVESYDKQFMPFTKVTCPHCGNVTLVPIYQIKDFFFPTEI